MSAYSVYKHTSPSGKVYIGITAKPVKRRWRGGSAYRNNTHFYAAIKKYGWGAFRHVVIASGLTREQACDMERDLIKKFDSTNPDRGYNHSPGGDKTTLGYKYSPESRKLISEKAKGRRKGVPLTDEHKEHIRQALTGRKQTAEQREKARRALGDRFQTEAARKKQKENTPKGARHPKAQPVVCVDTGETWGYIQEAADATGVSRSSISRCCRGSQKTAGGYKWSYALRLEILQGEETERHG